MKPKRSPEQAANLAALVQAARMVELKWQTLGPCHYCGWPRCHCAASFPEGMFIVCDICHNQGDTLLRLQGDHDFPAAAI